VGRGATVKAKEGFWSGLKGGIFDEKHHKVMGEAIWLFGWLVTRQTQLSDAGEGIVSYGNPITREGIAADTGYPTRSIKLWTDRLRQTGYLRTEYIRKRGTIFFVLKGKSKAKNPKPNIRYFPAELQADGNYRVTKSVTDEGHRHVRQNRVEGHQDVRVGTPECPSNSRISLEQRAVADSSTTLNSKSLFNYNTTPPAKGAGSLLSSLSKAKSVPRSKSVKEQDETRRVLLGQIPEILAKYPAKPIVERQATA
jgi:hypothetical protein